LADEVLEMVDSDDEGDCDEPVMEGSDDNFSDLEYEDHEYTLVEEGWYKGKEHIYNRYTRF
jgi:hypothetical protein